jgi:hypothetical protein
MLRFAVELKNRKLKTYTVISWLIIALNFISFLYVGVTRIGGIMNLPFFTAGVLAFLFFIGFISRNLMTENDRLGLAFPLSIIVWIILQFYWAAIIVFFLFLFQDISRRKLTVLFFDDNIVYPSFPKRIIEWKDLNNVVLKDGLLTIDLKTDKIFQNEILSLTIEDEFNEFCNTKLVNVRSS